jgi:hypothetical protein
LKLSTDTFERTSAAMWRSAVTYIAAGMLAIALQSCSTVRNLSEGAHNPMTPEQSKTQVVNAAREIVTTLALKGVSANFARDSCNDQAVAPFRGRVELNYDQTGCHGGIRSLLPCPERRRINQHLRRMPRHVHKRKHLARADTVRSVDVMPPNSPNRPVCAGRPPP